jgi:hypothetical protein
MNADSVSLVAKVGVDFFSAEAFMTFQMTNICKSRFQIGFEALAVIICELKLCWRIIIWPGTDVMIF